MQEAGNRPVEWLHQVGLQAANARQTDLVLEASVVQALSFLHLENGWQGVHLPSSRLLRQNVRTPPVAQAAHLERTTFIVDRGTCCLDLGE